MTSSTLKKNINVSENDIINFCKKWNVVEFGIFGSALRGDFTMSSDVDILVQFAPNMTPGLIKLGGMVRELEQIFSRKVDILTRKSVESCPNIVRKSSILSSVEVLYAA